MSLVSWKWFSAVTLVFDKSLAGRAIAGNQLGKCDASWNPPNSAKSSSVMLPFIDIN